MPFEYRKRLAENILNEKLNSSGCVLVTGPKFCGKTTLCQRFAKSSVSLKNGNTIALANSDPKGVLKGEHPRLIDEWQKAPELWNEIKADLDEDHRFGKYIITGSTTPIDPSKIQHSGAGRISTMNLKPFSLYESGESSGLISLSELFQAKETREDLNYVLDNPIGLEDIAYMLCRGGWPISLMAKREYAIATTENYYEGLFRIENESDDFALFLKNKDVSLLTLVLKSFARNISTQAKKSSMRKDILESNIRETLDDETFSSYERTLKDLFIIYDMPAWNLNLRSTIAIRNTPTHHFVDTSMATCALGIEPSDLINDLHSFGFFFEDLAVRDLSIYADSIQAKLKHYRDSSGREVDAIVELRNGNYAAIEIKIYSDENIKDAFASLNKFEKALKQDELKLPQFKMVLTSHGPCYRKDGIYVVPITMLKN